MAFEMEFTPIALEDLHHEAAVKKTDGWRFIQTHAVNTDNGIDLYYSFMKNGVVDNLKVSGVTKDQSVPSITDLFLAAFVFENEARELFGVDMRDIAIDFAGGLYAPAESEPMTFITPEQKAARDKARKALEAKASQVGDAPEAKGEPSANKPRIFVMTPERRERLNKKLANMSPDKVAKVEAALKAREAEAAAASAAPSAKAPDKAPENAAGDDSPMNHAEIQQAPDAAPMRDVDHQLERALSLLGDKAAKVRAAIAARNGIPEQVDEMPPADAFEIADEDLQAKIALMDEAKAEKVRKALAAKAAREASTKGGE